MKRRFTIAMAAALMAALMLCGSISAAVSLPAALPGALTSVMYFDVKHQDGSFLVHRQEAEGDIINIYAEADNAVLKTTYGMLCKLQRDGFEYIRFTTNKAVSFIMIDIFAERIYWGEEMVLTHTGRSSSLNYEGTDIAPSNKN